MISCQHIGWFAFIQMLVIGLHAAAYQHKYRPFQRFDYYIAFICFVYLFFVFLFTIAFCLAIFSRNTMMHSRVTNKGGTTGSMAQPAVFLVTNSNFYYFITLWLAMLNMMPLPCLETHVSPSTEYMLAYNFLQA
ncbi:hypothetical protein ACJX0J_022737 [Zea mays]